MTTEQRSLYEAILSGPRGSTGAGHLLANDGSLLGPFGPMLLSPSIGSRLQDLGASLRFQSSLPTGVLELAILVVANEWECEFEWRVHASLALDNGVPASMIEAVRTGAAVGSADNVLGMVRAAVEELLGTRRLSDQTHEQLTEAIGEQGIFELLAVCGYYVLLAMVLNGHEVE